MKFDRHDVYEYVKKVAFNPITPIVIGVVNLVAADSLAGATLGCILIVAGISEWYENK